MLLSIVITTRDRLEDLLNCVQSIFSSNLDKIEWELIIVDDASKDETKNITPDSLNFNYPQPKKIKLIHLVEVSMMVKARNTGLKESSGDFLLFIDDDNIVDPNMIPILCNFADAHHESGIVGPSMYHRDRTKYLDLQRINLFTGKTSGIVLSSPPECSESDGIPNVFMVKREVINVCGPFDESLVQTFVEPDYSYRAKTNGYKTFIVESAKTVHMVSHQDIFTSKILGGKFSQKAYYLMRNRTVLVKRYGNTLQKITYLLCFSWIWPLVYSILILRERRFDLIKLYWHGWLDGIRFFAQSEIE